VVDRRKVIKGGFAASTQLALGGWARGAKGAPKPNIIHILADDMRYDDIAVMPNVRRIFKHAAVSFSCHMVAFSVCAPSRASILTGLQAHNHGVLGNQDDIGGYGVYRTLEGNALPVWLTAAGYHVGHVGKFINNYGKDAPKHVPPGYADWRAMCDKKLDDYNNFTLNENGTLVEYTGQYTTDVFVEKVLDFVSTAPQPYALFFWPNAPHGPSTPDQQDKGTFSNVDMPIHRNFNEANVKDKPALIRDLPLLDDTEIAAIQDLWRSRAECLQSLDRGVAALVDQLKQSGQLENTHIVFTSDNGFMLGEHRVDDAKDLLYEESTRVPLLWRMPGGAGGKRDVPVSNIDVTAAIVEVTGATAGRVLDGRSLVPLLNDAETPWNTAVLIQCGEARGIATQQYRYMVWTDTGETELYDMADDPYQLRNVAGTHKYRKIETDLAAAFAALDQCSGTSCEWTGSFPPPPLDNGAHK